MKKKIFYYLFFIISFFLFIPSLKASTIEAKIIYNNVNLRSGPGVNYDVIRQLGIDATFALVNNDLHKDEKGCPAGWYQIIFSGNNKGYVCADYVELVTVEQTFYETNTECEKEMQEKGFPQSYWQPLCQLKTAYPNWSFEADKNGLDFMTAVSKESVVGKSLIQSTSEGYLSTSEGSYDYLTDTFTVKEGKNWYAASDKVVAYYLDPRNFFDEKSIFMFEKLSYDESYQTEEAVKKVLNGRDIASYSGVVIEASKTNNVNAIYLASKIRQETGGNFSNTSLMGLEISYGGQKYSTVYNPYNIGANTGAMDGLVWAVAGSSYLRPWTTLSGAILGGAQVISNTYISQGQDTIYFQKFNTSSYSVYASYAHQYMTNIKAASSEAAIAYEGYKGMDILSSTNFTFIIPVYNNMNSENPLPNPGNPNNHLKSLEINNVSVTNFSHNNFDYTFYVSGAVDSVDVSAQSINSKATIGNVGTNNLTGDETLIVIPVTSANGVVQNYNVKVIKTDGGNISAQDIVGAMQLPISDSFMILSAGTSVESLIAKAQKTSASASVVVSNRASGNLSTGDVVTIKNGNSSISYNAVIKGDCTGDGNINIQDLLRVQKYILGYADVSGSYLKASDSNQDGKVDIADLLRIQKHILGYLTIS